jgi:hypothetical protein
MACFIGFGSLVNTATHKYQPLAAVRVPGWSRAWINNDLYDHAFLSVVPQAEQSILGLLAAVPDRNWRELDQREAGYDRKPMEPSDWQITVSEFEPAAESMLTCKCTCMPVEILHNPINQFCTLILKPYCLASIRYTAPQG